LNKSRSIESVFDFSGYQRILFFEHLSQAALQHLLCCSAADKLGFEESSHGVR